MKDIKGYEGLYAITEDGQVWSIKRKRFLKNFLLNGYLAVGLTKDGKTKNKHIHRLIAEAYIPNPDNKPTVDHINRNRLDNRLENLRWATVVEQVNNRENTRPIYCVETDEIYPNQLAAARALGCDQGNISKVLRGIIKKHHGYHFQFVD